MINLNMNVTKKTGRYIIVNNWEGSRINSNSKHKGILPRLHSTEHAANYMNFTAPLEFEIKPEYRRSAELKKEVDSFRRDAAEGTVSGEDYHTFFKQMSPYLNIEKPSFISNMRYLFEYQIGYMYVRYFMWNFAGRQNDIQGRFTTLNGNWISGIPFIDAIRLGNQSELSEDILNNKARNTYFFLPLILGLIGLFFLYGQDKMKFWVLMLFFLFTGLALKVYLNERPFEPRERDYALVGSFYVFAIWIGIGTFALIQNFKQILKSKFTVPASVLLCFLAVPVLMAFQNWDDHDRSNRYTAQSISNRI